MEAKQRNFSAFQPTGTATTSYEKHIQSSPQQLPPSKRELVWHNIILLTLLHVYTTWHFAFTRFSLLMWTFQLCYGYLGGIGTTAGVHRLWTHRAYKAKLPLRVFFALCFSASAQNTIPNWVRDHRVHHKFTETDADPHNAKRGFFFAHVGWLMQRKHPEVLRQGAKVNISDVLADPVVQWHQRYFWPLKLIFALLVPLLIPVYCWNETWIISLSATLCRTVGLLNVTWLVNSAAHIYGSRPYDTQINASENFFVSFLSIGEGWHNFHHTFPWDYKASEHTLFMNATTKWLDFFAKMGWAYDMRSTKPEMIRTVALHQGDGSHAMNAYANEISYDEFQRKIKESDR